MGVVQLRNTHTCDTRVLSNAHTHLRALVRCLLALDVLDAADSRISSQAHVCLPDAGHDVQAGSGGHEGAV